MSRACVYCRPPAKRRTSGRLQPPCGCWVELALVVRYSQSHLPFWYSNPLLRYSQPPNRYSHLPIKYSYSLPRYSHLPIRCPTIRYSNLLLRYSYPPVRHSHPTIRNFNSPFRYSHPPLRLPHYLWTPRIKSILIDSTIVFNIPQIPQMSLKLASWHCNR